MITDAQVEAALVAFGVGPLDQDRLHDLMRAALEAAAQAAPAWTDKQLAEFAEKYRERAYAAPAPTAAPGETRQTP
jgi:DNA-binding protein YbaB